MPMKKFKLAVKKTHKKTIKIKSRKTTFNKRLASKIVANWELKAVVP